MRFEYFILEVVRRQLSKLKVYFAIARESKLTDIYFFKEYIKTVIHNIFIYFSFT